MEPDIIGLRLEQFKDISLDMSPHGARTPKMDEVAIREEISKLRGELPHGAEFILYYMREESLTLQEAKDVWIAHVNSLCGGNF